MKPATQRRRRRQPREFDEADLLRAAAVIVDLLGDYRARPWRDVLDELRDFTEGNRADASDLGWKTITGPLTDTRLVWSGERGARTVALAPPAEAVLSVDCPKCSAPTGEPCERLAGTRSAAKSWPHAEREQALADGEPAPATA